MVPADRDPGRRRGRRLAAMAAVAAVAGGAVLFGTTPPAEQAAPGRSAEIPPPDASFTTTDLPFVSELAGDWRPTWLPGEGTFVGVVNRPDGTVLAVATSTRGVPTSTVWASPDGRTWSIRDTLGGVVTALTGLPDLIVAVGYDTVDVSGGRRVRPVAWIDDGSGFGRVELPTEVEGVAASVTPTATGVAAVGWRTAAVPTGRVPPPALEALAWWSPGGVTWTEVPVDAAFPAGMYTVAATSGLAVAGGDSGGRATLWESADGGQTWHAVDQPATVWPTGYAFTSLAPLPDGMVASSGIRGSDPPRTSLWRRTSEGWERMQPEGMSEYLSRFLGRVATAGDEVAGFDLGSFERRGRLWASPDGVEWTEIEVVDPCGACDPQVYPRFQVTVATPDLLGGSVFGQPVLWTRTGADVAVGVTEPGWAALDVELGDGASVAYWSPELTVMTGHGGAKVLLGGEEVTPDWGGIAPAYLDEVVVADGGWLVTGWSEGGGMVWRSVDGVVWEPVARGSDQVGLVSGPGGAEPIVVGIDVEALVPDVEVIDLADQPDHPTYLIGVETFAGGVVVFGPENVVTRGIDLDLPPDLIPTGVARVGDRLVVAGFPIQGGLASTRPRVFLLDAAGRIVAGRDDLPLSPWTLTRVGDLVAASGLDEGSLWVSADGEEWSEVPVDAAAGFPGIPGRLVATDGDLVMQAVAAGRSGLWRWTGSLPAG